MAAAAVAGGRPCEGPEVEAAGRSGSVGLRELSSNVVPPGRTLHLGLWRCVWDAQCNDRRG